MERPRCALCRNPVRDIASKGLQRPDGCYHSDCWAQACVDQQRRYAAMVQAEGLLALLAPYLRAEPVPVPAPNDWAFAAALAESRTGRELGRVG